MGYGLIDYLELDEKLKEIGTEVENSDIRYEHNLKELMLYTVIGEIEAGNIDLIDACTAFGIDDNPSEEEVIAQIEQLIGDYSTEDVERLLGELGLYFNAA